VAGALIDPAPLHTALRFAEEPRFEEAWRLTSDEEAATRAVAEPLRFFMRCRGPEGPGRAVDHPRRRALS
jgi:hypothetical protein